jgi:nitrate reductase gamma subunit
MELSFIFAMLFLVFLLIFGIVILSLPVSAFMDEPSPDLEKFKKITGGVLVGSSCFIILFLIIFRRSIKDKKSFHALKGANILLRSPFYR